MIHTDKSEYVIFKEEQIGALGDPARYLALTTLTCVRIPVTSFAVDKLLPAAAQKVTVATPVDSLATRFDLEAYRRRRRRMAVVPRTTRQTVH